MREGLWNILELLACWVYIATKLFISNVDKESTNSGYWGSVLLTVWMGKCNVSARRHLPEHSADRYPLKLVWKSSSLCLLSLHKTFLTPYSTSPRTCGSSLLLLAWAVCEIGLNSDDCCLRILKACFSSDCWCSASFLLCLVLFVLWRVWF